MSEVVGEGVIRIRQDESGVDFAGAGRRGGDGYSKGFLGGIKGIALGIGAVLATGKALDFVKESIGEAREAQKVGAATASILKATGSAANLTAGQVGNLASALSAKTAVDDEQIQAGENLLLTFKNVKKEGEGLDDVFGRATAAGLDLAAAGFGSVEGNALQLGKALNDPLKGISALGRAGVTFTAAQKEQIKGYVESNDLLSAQKIILGEVEHQVGGTAEATATSGEKASVAFGNIKETVGTALLPVLDRLANVFVTTIAPAITGLVNNADALNPVLYAVQLAISTVIDAFSGGNDSVNAFSAIIQSVVAGALPLLQQAFATLLPVAINLFSSLQTYAATVLPIIAGFILNQLVPAVTSLVSYFVSNVLPIFVQFAGIVTTQVIPVLTQIATFVYGTLLPALLNIYANVAEKLKPVFDQLVATFRDTLLPAFSQLVTQIQTELLPVLEPFIQKVVAVGGFLAGLAATILGALLPPLIRLAGFLIANIVPAIVKFVTVTIALVNGIASFIASIGRAIGTVAGFAGSLKTLVSAGLNVVLDAITGLPGKITALGGKLLSAGKEIIGEFLKGLSFPGGGIPGIAEGIVDAVKGAINGLIDRLNGLLEFTIKVGPKSFTVNPPNIGHLQGGSNDVAAGFYTTGEVGPERVFLPDGARVQTAAQTRQAASGETTGLAAAIAAALTPLLTDLANRPNLSVTLPTGDPEAAAMMLLNRLAAL